MFGTPGGVGRGDHFGDLLLPEIRLRVAADAFARHRPFVEPGPVERKGEADEVRMPLPFHPSQRPVSLIEIPAKAVTSIN